MIPKNQNPVINKNQSTFVINNSENLFPKTQDEQHSLEDIFSILSTHSKVKFAHYHDTTILRRLTRRMSICKLENYRDYYEYLKNNQKEVNILYQDLLLLFTKFFRDSEVFKALKNKIYPKLIENRTEKTPIRIWVAGCSTGEDVYSLAISLYEFIEKQKINVPIQFFGTDLVEKNIIHAQSGIYPDRITQDISQKRLARFFDKTPSGYKIIKPIREMCVFAVQNITQGPQFPNIDLISCRDVLIYFDVTFKETIAPLFHFALKPGGFLLLGSSETLGKFPQLFSIFDHKSNIYIKSNTDTIPTENTLNRSKINANTSVSTKKTKSIELNQQINQLLINSYVPPGILVDSNMYISQFYGHTFPYLNPVGGEASLKLSCMVGESLMPDLYVAIEEVKKRKIKITKQNISIKKQEKTSVIDITVIPVHDSNINETNYLILFEENIKSQTPKFDTTKIEQNYEIQKLKKELQITKEQLQKTIENKNKVSQELWAANEEVESSNNELTSLNKKVIQESEEKYRTLVSSMSDIIFVLDENDCFVDVHCKKDSALLIPPKEFIGKKYIEVMPTHSHKLYEQVVNDVRETGNTQRFEYPLQIDNKELWFSATLDLHEDGKKIIAGIRDITLRKQAEIALQKSEERFKNLFEKSPVPLWEEDFSKIQSEINLLKNSGIIDFVKYFKDNPKRVMAFSNMVKVLDINEAVLDLHEAKSKKELFLGLSSIFTEKSFQDFETELIALATGKTTCEFEGTVKTISGKEKYVSVQWAVVPDYEETMERVYVSTIDITERKQAERSLEQKLKELERFNKVVIDRELKMIELKKEINQLCKKLNIEEKYKIHTDSEQNEN